MPFDENLADRIRAALGDREDVREQKMFGGIAFMVAGSMACGIIGDELMARVGDDRYEKALARPHARLMAFTGRPMKGFVIVGTQGIKTAAALKKWVDETVAFATSPEQKAKAAKKKRAKPRPRPTTKKRTRRI